MEHPALPLPLRRLGDIPGNHLQMQLVFLRHGNHLLFSLPEWLGFVKFSSIFTPETGYKTEFTTLCPPSFKQPLIPLRKVPFKIKTSSSHKKSGDEAMYIPDFCYFLIRTLPLLHRCGSSRFYINLLCPKAIPAQRRRAESRAHLGNELCYPYPHPPQAAASQSAPPNSPQPAAPAAHPRR